MLILFGYDIPNGSLILRISGEASSVRPRWELSVLRRLAWLALPLGFATMFISINALIPRYYIERYAGERELGIFAAMAYLIVVGEKVINAAGQSAFPRLGQYYSQRDTTAFRALLLKLMDLAALLAAGGICAALWFGRELLALLYRAEYAERADVLVWVMVAAGISYFASCLGYGITATRAFRHFLVPYLAVTLVAVGTSALLVPMKGILGAAWTLSIVSLVSCVVPLFVFRIVSEHRRA